MTITSETAPIAHDDDLISHRDARRIASLWHASGTNAGLRLLVFSRTGAITDDTDVAVWALLADASTADTPDLCALLIYVRAYGNRPEVPGWGLLTWEETQP